MIDLALLLLVNSNDFSWISKLKNRESDVEWISSLCYYWHGHDRCVQSQSSTLVSKPTRGKIQMWSRVYGRHGNDGREQWRRRILLATTFLQGVPRQRLWQFPIQCSFCLAIRFGFECVGQCYRTSSCQSIMFGGGCSTGRSWDYRYVSSIRVLVLDYNFIEILTI